MQYHLSVEVAQMMKQLLEKGYVERILSDALGREQQCKPQDFWIF